MPIDVTIGAIAAAAAQQARRRRAIEKAELAWSAYAKAHGLTYDQARGWLRREWPRVEGKLDGVDVALEVAIRATRWDYGTACVAALSAGAPGTLEVVREGIASRIAGLFGGQDIVIGDEAFDRAFVVESAPEALATEILTPATRRAITELQLERFTYGEVGEGGARLVTAEFLGIVDDPSRIDRTLAFLTELARSR